MSDKKIELNHVRYAIRDKAILDDISLSIAEGERVAICGPNGAGYRKYRVIVKELYGQSMERLFSDKLLR